MILVYITFFIAFAYVCFVLAFTIGLKRTLCKNNGSVDRYEKVSVVIAFRNEEVNLPILLNALSTQTLSQNLFELILVNDHSTDNSQSVAEVYSSRFQNFKLVTSPLSSKGKKAALAYGIELASNPIIVFTDADCVPSSFWLEVISQKAANGSNFIVGAVAMNPTNNFASKFQSLEYASLMAVAAGSCGVGHPVIASSANLAFRKDLFSVDSESMNPRISSGDDMFLLHKAKRLRDFSIEFLNDSNGIVRTSTEENIWNALKQRRRWASKSPHYKDFDTIVVGLIVLLFNLSLIALLFATIIDFRYFFYFIFLLVVKTFVDFLLLKRYLKFTGQDELLKVFLPLQLVYPFYVACSFFAGLFIKGHWKGRAVT